MDLRSIPKRTLHLTEDLRSTLFVVKIEASDGQVIAVRERVGSSASAVSNSPLRAS